jgi:DNA-directed RNA polymerase
MGSSEEGFLNKTYLEMATEVVTAMINKGYLRVAVDKGKDWKDYNHEAVHTVGWAILEMYREVARIPTKAKEPVVKATQKRIIPAR